MASGSRSILLSRWPVAGQSTFDLVREYVQELPFVPAAEAWQRSVQLARANPIAARIGTAFECSRASGRTDRRSSVFLGRISAGRFGTFIAGGGASPGGRPRRQTRSQRRSAGGSQTAGGPRPSRKPRRGPSGIEIDRGSESCTRLKCTRWSSRFSLSFAGTARWHAEAEPNEARPSSIRNLLLLPPAPLATIPPPVILL